MAQQTNIFRKVQDLGETIGGTYQSDTITRVDPQQLRELPP